jgi:hypothetical protein
MLRIPASREENFVLHIERQPGAGAALARQIVMARHRKDLRFDNGDVVLVLDIDIYMCDLLVGRALLGSAAEVRRLRNTPVGD